MVALFEKFVSYTVPFILGAYDETVQTDYSATQASSTSNMYNKYPTYAYRVSVRAMIVHLERKFRQANEIRDLLKQIFSANAVPLEANQHIDTRFVMEVLGLLCAGYTVVEIYKCPEKRPPWWQNSCSY